MKTAAGHVAEGTLTLRGVDQPVSLPFDLVIDGNTAQMTGTTTLDRRNYDIGAGQTDEGQLGFGVGVTVDLVAERGDDRPSS